MNGEQAERILSETASFWARVEILGRRVYNGKVTIETLGGSALLRVDVPIIPEHTVRERGYFKADGDDRGTEYGLYEVTYPVTAGHSHLIGIGSIYELTPITEDVAMQLVSRAASKGNPIKVTRVVDAPQIEAAGKPTHSDCQGCGDDPCTCNDPF